MAIAINVGDRTTGRPTRIIIAGKARRIGRIMKSAVPVVDVQAIATNVGNMQIRPTVAVDISGGHSLSKACLLQPGRFGHVFESTVTTVAKQPVRVAGVVPIDRPVGALGQIHIRPTVSVVVEDSNTTTSELEHPPLAVVADIALEEPERQSRCGRVVTERGHRRGAGTGIFRNRTHRPLRT